MKIGLVQFAPEWENPVGNINKIDSLIKTMPADVNLLIFPEMTLTGFTMKSTEFAEELDGISTKYFIELSGRHKIEIIAGIIERDNNKIFNSAVHFNSMGLIMARYRKIHLFSHSSEDKHYDSSKEIIITKIRDARVGLTICYDLRFPELYRLYAKGGVDIIINIANWPIQRVEHWNHLLKARAIENLCYMIGINRTGVDPFYKYSGQSAVYEPFGNQSLVADDNEGIFVIDIDLSKVSGLRSKFNFLNDIKLI